MARRVVEIQVSYGDLIDRITILEIKAERIRGAEKLANVFRELQCLLETLATIGDPVSDDAQKAAADLRRINQEIWDDEDRIRLADDEREIACIAVRIFQNNDRRHAAKRKIDDAVGSEIVEEKSY